MLNTASVSSSCSCLFTASSAEQSVKQAALKHHWLVPKKVSRAGFASYSPFRDVLTRLSSCI